MRLNQLVACDCTPITVFDGGKNPFKRRIDDMRRQKAAEASARIANALQLQVTTDKASPPSAKDYIAAAKNVPLELVLVIMAELNRRDFPFIRSFREADAELKYLDSINFGDYVLTYDTDLIVLGCRRVLMCKK